MKESKGRGRPVTVNCKTLTALTIRLSDEQIKKLYLLGKSNNAQAAIRNLLDSMGA